MRCGALFDEGGAPHPPIEGRLAADEAELTDRRLRSSGKHHLRLKNRGTTVGRNEPHHVERQRETVPHPNAGNGLATGGTTAVNRMAPSFVYCLSGSIRRR